MIPPPDTPAPRTAAAALAAALVVAFWSAAMLWPVLRAPSTTLPMDAGDPVLNASILHWNATRIPLTAAWWNFPAYAPAEGVTAFTEHLLGLWPLATPVIWTTGDPVLGYNVAFFLSFVLNALTTFALVRTLTASNAGALVAALAFTCSPYRGGQFSHIQMLMTWGMPLALLGLHRYLAGGRPGALVLFAAGWLVTALSNNYFIVFFGVYVGCWVLWFTTTRGAWRRLPGMAAALLLASLPLVPILLQYVDVHAAYGFVRGGDEIRGYSADVTGLGFAHPAASVATRLVPRLHEEGALFPGFAVLILGLAGAVRGAGRGRSVAGGLTPGRLALAAAAVFLAATVVAALTDVRLRGPIPLSISNPERPLTLLVLCLALAAVLHPRLRAAIAARDTALFYALSALAMWLLSLGPEVRLAGQPVTSQSPYAWLLLVPGTDGLRVPARFWMLALLSLSVLAGMAVATLSRRRVLAAIVASAVLLAEGWMDVTAAPIPGRRGPLPADANATVLELPIGSILDEIAAQYRGVVGGYRTVNGYSGFEPPHVHPLRVGVRLREGAILTELRRVMPLHVSVLADNADGLRSWVTDTQQDARPVAEAAGRILYLLPRLPSPPVPEEDARRFVIAGVSCSPDKAALAVDGSLATRWECGQAWPGQQISVDLQVREQVSAVSLALGPYAGDAPRSLLVEASDEGQTWRPIWTGLGAPPALRAAIADPRRMEVRIGFPPLRTRYLRLTQTGDPMEWFWSIAELGVLGPR